MKLKDKIYDTGIVKKPWGFEYVLLRDKNSVSVTFLNIDYKKQTSLHCHPQQKTGFIILKGNNQSVESKKFKLFSKKFISFDNINKIANSEGDVKLFLNGPTTISSERINASFDKINNTLISASAKGKVKIQTKSETITCNSAKYDNKTNIITLKNNVIIERDKSTLTGERGYMNLKTLKSKIESSKSQRVKGIFKPLKK